jgi:hypothetical protein
MFRTPVAYPGAQLRPWQPSEVHEASDRRNMTDGFFKLAQGLSFRIEWKVNWGSIDHLGPVVLVTDCKFNLIQSVLDGVSPGRLIEDSSQC